MNIFLFIVNNRFQLLILSVSFIPFSTLVAQQGEHNVERKTMTVPRFDVHIGVGWVNGGRVGIRALFHENFSAEISLGYDVRNFIAASDEQIKFSTGINWHPSKKSPFIMSLLIVRDKKINLSPSPSYLLSINVGSLSFRNSGIHPFIRAGIYTEILSDRPRGNTTIGPNLDVGLSYTFP